MLTKEAELPTSYGWYQAWSSNKRRDVTPYLAQYLDGKMKYFIYLYDPFRLKAIELKQEEFIFEYFKIPANEEIYYERIEKI